MPQRKCAVKALKQSQKHQMHNLDIKSDLKKFAKEFVATVKTDVKKAASLLPTLYKKLDKAAKRNIFSKKTAARRKSRFTKLLKATKA
ncbi:MAG: 30S ribosomal protein S20 [Candidatus Omnitrophica bacterium]|nr:30S ribosomal protein S20 [Candidatus Omnitrophota bacterium]